MNGRLVERGAERGGRGTHREVTRDDTRAVGEIRLIVEEILPASAGEHGGRRANHVATACSVLRKRNAVGTKTAIQTNDPRVFQGRCFHLHYQEEGIITRYFRDVYCKLALLRKQRGDCQGGLRRSSCARANTSGVNPPPAARWVVRKKFGQVVDPGLFRTSDEGVRSSSNCHTRSLGFGNVKIACRQRQDPE